MSPGRFVSIKLRSTVLGVRIPMPRRDNEINRETGGGGLQLAWAPARGDSDDFLGGLCDVILVNRPDILAKSLEVVFLGVL
jgi:hypothetical protein